MSRTSDLMGLGIPAAVALKLGDNFLSETLIPTANGQFNLGSDVSNRINSIYCTLVDVQGNLIVSAAGSGLRIKEGSNARMGTATLNGTTGVTVSNTSVGANTRIWLTGVGATNAGILSIGTITAGTSFVILSSNASDTRTCHWLLVEPS